LISNKDQNYWSLFYRTSKWQQLRQLSWAYIGSFIKRFPFNYRWTMVPA